MTDRKTLTMTLAHCLLYYYLSFMKGGDTNLHKDNVYCKNISKQTVPDAWDIQLLQIQ